MGEMSVARTSFLTEHFFGGEGGCFSGILPLLACLAPAVPLKWARAPPAGQLIISRCPLHPHSQPLLSVSVSAVLCCGSLGRLSLKKTWSSSLQQVRLWPLGDAHPSLSRQALQVTVIPISTLVMPLPASCQLPETHTGNSATTFNL